MGMAASQARFLQLTARRSNIEYEAQQLAFQRLQLANQTEIITSEYNDKMSNTKLTFDYISKEGSVKTIDLSYSSYMNLMHEQQDPDVALASPFYLVSSSGNKLVVGSEEDMNKMIKNSAGKSREFTKEDFMIAPDLNNQETFDTAIKNGVYRFAQLKQDENGKMVFDAPENWESLGSGSIREEYDKSDDAAAEADYETKMAKIQNKDKKLELELNQLESERDAINTEIESVQKVLDDNVETSFKSFG